MKIKIRLEDINNFVYLATTFEMLQIAWLYVVEGLNAIEFRMSSFWKLKRLQLPSSFISSKTLSCYHTSGPIYFLIGLYHFDLIPICINLSQLFCLCIAIKVKEACLGFLKIWNDALFIKNQDNLKFIFKNMK